MCQTCHGIGIEYNIDLNLLLDYDLSLNESAIKHPNWHEGKWYFKNLKASKLFPMDKPLRKWNKKTMNKLLYLPKTKFKVDEKASLVTRVSFEGIVNVLNSYRFGADRSSYTVEKTNKYYKKSKCSECSGSRISREARAVKWRCKFLQDVMDMELGELLNFIVNIEDLHIVEKPILLKVKETLSYLCNLGVGYLSLSQPTGTLSGGESQRIKFAKQLTCSLVDMMYILDEPTVGLHPHDIGRLLAQLKNLRDKGNSVIVVEHEREVMEIADYIIDIGPGAGQNGGNLCFMGTIKELKSNPKDSITAEYLLKENKPIKPKRRAISKKFFRIKKANLHNLQNVSVKIPKKCLVGVTGVAGSGKSTLIMDVFCKQQKKAIIIDQCGVWKNSRSNPLTYTQTFGEIRKLFAKKTGQSASLFSFNSTGSCEECKGLGKIKMEMHFLDDVSVPCKKCNGKRYKSQVLKYKMNGKSISDVLSMTVNEGFDFFKK
eukprot:Anaeramoba_flamelloidesa810375_28.p1 GENE.a810375_28~~a810375_28.p1  ORF type:complete len:487 (-),score=117.42 a810375_28:37-1497(-)